MAAKRQRDHGGLDEDVQQEQRSALALALFTRRDPSLYGSKNERHCLFKKAYGTHQECTGGSHANG